MGSFASSTHSVARTLELALAHDRCGRAVLVGHGSRQQRVLTAGRGTLEVSLVARSSWPRGGRRGSKAARAVGEASARGDATTGSGTHLTQPHTRQEETRWPG